MTTWLREIYFNSQNATAPQGTESSLALINTLKHYSLFSALNVHHRLCGRVLWAFLWVDCNGLYRWHCCRMLINLIDCMIDLPMIERITDAVSQISCWGVCVRVCVWHIWQEALNSNRPVSSCLTCLHESSHNTLNPKDAKMQHQYNLRLNPIT